MHASGGCEGGEAAGNEVWRNRRQHIGCGSKTTSRKADARPDADARPPRAHPRDRPLRRRPRRGGGLLRRRPRPRARRPRRDRHVFFRLAGAMLLIFNPAETERPPTGLPVPPHGARGPGHLAFAASATDLDAWRARLVAAGVAIEADFLGRTARARSTCATPPATPSSSPSRPSGASTPREARRRSITLAKYASPPPPHASQAPCLDTARGETPPRHLGEIRSRRRRTRKGGVRAAGGRAGRRERRPASARGARITAAASSDRR